MTSVSWLEIAWDKSWMLLTIAWCRSWPPVKHKLNPNKEETNEQVLLQWQEIILYQIESNQITSNQITGRKKALQMANQIELNQINHCKEKGRANGYTYCSLSIFSAPNPSIPMRNGFWTKVCRTKVDGNMSLVQNLWSKTRKVFGCGDSPKCFEQHRNFILRWCIEYLQFFH